MKLSTMFMTEVSGASADRLPKSFVVEIWAREGSESMEQCREQGWSCIQ
jgi:hypothetical protein